MTMLYLHYVFTLFTSIYRLKFHLTKLRYSTVKWCFEMFHRFVGVVIVLVLLVSDSIRTIVYWCAFVLRWLRTVKLLIIVQCYGDEIWWTWGKYDEITFRKDNFFSRLVKIPVDWWPKPIRKWIFTRETCILKQKSIIDFFLLAHILKWGYAL